jgi:hypothetical protein
MKSSQSFPVRQQRLIGLVGPSGSGKTTVCTYLESNERFVTTHVASPLKWAYCMMFQAPLSHTERPEIDLPKEYLGGVTPRVVLEQIGTRLHEVAPMAIPLSLRKRVLALRRDGVDNILVDGIRRKTEGMIIQSLGGTVWRLSGDGDIDPGKPCDLSQLQVAHDEVVPWLESKQAMFGVLDALLAKCGGRDGVGNLGDGASV